MNRIQYLIKNTLVFALGTIGTKLIGFFLVPLYTKVLLTEEYGVADLVFTLSTFLVPILILNINEAVLRFLLDKDANQNKIMSIGLLSIGTMIVVATCAYPLLRLYKPIADYSVYVLCYIISSGCNTVFLYNLRGKELLLRFSIGNIINALCVALLNILFLLHFDMGLKGYFLAYIIANFITTVYSFFAGDVFSTIRHFSFDKPLMLAMIKYSIVLIPNSFMWWVMDSSNRLLLTSLSGIAVSGMYAVAAKLPSLVSVVSTIFNQAWNYSAIKERDSEDSLAYNNSVFDFLITVVIGISSVILLLLKPFMSIYVEPAYYEAWKYTPPLIVGAVFLVLATFLASSYTVHKDSRGFLYSSLIGAAANIILNIILIPHLAASGAALATCMSYVAVFVFRFFNTKKYLKLSVFTAKHIIELACLFVAAIAVYLGNIGYIIIACELLVLIIIARENIRSVLHAVLKILKK